MGQIGCEWVFEKYAFTEAASHHSSCVDKTSGIGWASSGNNSQTRSTEQVAKTAIMFTKTEV